MLSKELEKLALMEIWNDKDIDKDDIFASWEKRREELAQMMQREIFGFIPDEPEILFFETVEENDRFAAGKVSLKKIIAKGKLNSREFSFPFMAAIPQDDKKHPFFVHVNFRPDVPDRYMPTEEICDNGFAVFSFCYKDVTSDDDNFNDGLAKTIYNGKERGTYDAGKIAMWAWAAMRVMDYAMSLDCLDFEKSAIVGHSRLGKTALLAGAVDTRFKYVISNCSGCSGAAISRGKHEGAETIKHIVEKFPMWFNINYQQYADNEYKQPFDQHFLIAASAPRYVLIGSAAKDLWADPDNEYLGVVAADEVYKKLGLKGFVHPDRFPQIGDKFNDGNLCYHLRDGNHYFSREDWLNYIECINK